MKAVQSTISTAGPSAGGNGPTASRLRLGTQLNRLRTAAEMSPDAAGYAIRSSRSKISRLENGRVSVKERDIRDLLSLYGVTDTEVRDSMLALARQASTPGWWVEYDDVITDWAEDYIGLEMAASVIRSFELQFVPGLFQTEDYARAVTRLGRSSAPDKEIDRRVALRLRRQELLSIPEPPRIWSVIDEAALRRAAGDRAAMRAQLRHLIELTALRHVTIQVVPFSRGAHPAGGGSFSLLRFSDPDLSDRVFVEHLTSAAYLDKSQDIEHYAHAASQLSVLATTPEETRDFLAGIMRDT